MYPPRIGLNVFCTTLRMRDAFVRESQINRPAHVPRVAAAPRTNNYSVGKLKAI